MIMVKYQYIDDAQLLKAFNLVGVHPSSWSKELEAKFKGRFRTRRSKHFYDLRKIIGLATGIKTLYLTAPRDFDKIDKEALRKECQDALPWDTKRHPYDIPFFAADGDPLGGEVLANIIKCWKEIVFHQLIKFEPSLTECPPIEDFVTMCRLVRKNFVFVFVLVPEFFFSSQMREWWGPVPDTGSVMSPSVHFNKTVGYWHEYVKDSVKKSDTLKVNDLWKDLGESLNDSFLTDIMGQVEMPCRDK